MFPYDKHEKTKNSVFVKIYSNQCAIKTKRQLRFSVAHTIFSYLYAFITHTYCKKNKTIKRFKIKKRHSSKIKKK